MFCFSNTPIPYVLVILKANILIVVSTKLTASIPGFFLLDQYSGSLWVTMASTLSSEACNRPEFMLNNGSLVPRALLNSRFQQ